MLAFIHLKCPAAPVTTGMVRPQREHLLSFNLHWVTLNPHRRTSNSPHPGQ
jgi:hypothetical protein